MKAVLQISNNNLQKRSEITISLAQNVVFGRSNAVDFVIEDHKMSSKHCRLLLKEDRLELYDLSSKNGTYLNGIRIDQSELFIGDEVRIGDTFITLLASKLDPSLIEILTFPGPFKERMQYELKADFTGAREKNLDWNKTHPGEKSSVYSMKEVELRKKAKTRIRLSKDEIRSKSPVLSSLSFVIDLGILLTMIILPVYFINRMARTGFAGISAEHFVSAKIVYITILEIVVIGIYLASQKYLRYTIGEKIAGIEDMHQKQ
jgi:pSer/pThr/pTyr-binding forkhead associated (FHA) protein